MSAQNTPGRWLVFNIGCIECGVSSNVVGTYSELEEADRIAAALDHECSWRQGGQNRFEVFDLTASQDPEYTAAIAKATGSTS